MRLAVVLALCGCGRIGFDLAGDGGSVDTAIDTAPLGPFGAPELIPELASAASTSNPTLSPDGLELFMIIRAGTGDVFVARRASEAAAWNAPVIVAELNSGADESGLHLSRDGLTMYFASTRAGTLGGHDLYSATRPSIGLPFAAPVHLVSVSTTSPDAGPTIDGGELLLIYNAGTVPRDLRASERASTGDAWPAATLISELATAADEAGPDLSPDGLTLYLASDAAGGAGGQDLYVTTRTSRSAPFGAPVALTSLNSSADDNTSWITADARTIYFASTRTGVSQLYRATR